MLIGALASATFSTIIDAAPVEISPPVAVIMNGAWATPEELEAAAASGAPNACVELGSRYLAGQDVPVDRERGIALYEKALAGGSIDAGLRLVKLLSGSAPGVDADPVRAFSAIRAGAILGEPNFQHHLGAVISRGQGAEADAVEGLAWMIVATRNGAPTSRLVPYRESLAADAARLTEAEQRADLIDQQLLARKATMAAPAVVKPIAPGRWTNLDGLKAAAERGAPNACAELAALLIEGGPFERDVPRALKLYAEAVRGGSADAAFELARIHHDGLHGTRTNLFQAFSYFKVAAYDGITLAQHNLGAMLVSGRGTDRDYAEGLAWLIIAEETGAEGNGAAQTRDRLSANPALIQRAERRAAALKLELKNRAAAAKS